MTSTRAENEVKAKQWNLNGRRCPSGHSGEWAVTSNAKGPHCRICHRAANVGWRAKAGAGGSPWRSLSIAPKKAHAHGQGQGITVATRRQRAEPHGFVAPPVDRFVLPWNRGIGPDDPSRP